MFTLMQIYEKAQKQALETQSTREWFWNAFDTENHVLPGKILELFGDPHVAQQWLFAPQGSGNECPALWIVRGERQKLIEALERTSNGFVG